MYKVRLSILMILAVYFSGCSQGGMPADSGQTRPERLVPLITPGTEMKKSAGGFSFTEGPAADKDGNIYFTDIPNNRIYKLTYSGDLSVYKIKTGGANGLFFDKRGNLLACLGGNRMLVLYPPNDGTTQVLAMEYEGKKFNSPNDLWVDPEGGVYFTDPRYGNRDDMEMGEHVYYLTPKRDKIIRVIDDFVRPNGIIGTPDGKLLYATDRGDEKTYVYRITSNGTLKGKKLFAEVGSDGMTLDEEGNLYVTTEVVEVYDKDGNKIETIKIPEVPANVCFGGTDRRTLYITARTSVYSIHTNVKGAY